jgi:hypothetical protein
MDIDDAIAVRLRITDSGDEARDCPVIASGILAHD